MTHAQPAYNKLAILVFLLVVIAIASTSVVVGILWFGSLNRQLPQPESPFVNGASTALPAFKVTRVVDGDTIKVQSLTQDEITVRLIGVDTPETSHPTKKVECFGQEAKAYLNELVMGKAVTLSADSTQDDQDRYGRYLRYVYVQDQLVNQLLISQGYGYEYTYRIPYQFQREFITAQQVAQTLNKGLWGRQGCARM